MSDPYLPPLEEFAFTEAEQQAIEAAVATAKPWDFAPGGVAEAAIATAKARIRDYHMLRHGERCCYCRRNLHGCGPFMIDREHILPKSIEAYRALAYTMWNLAVACKRCNMEYKRNDDGFVVTKGDPALLESGDNYRFIHPNFDLYKAHLSRSAVETDDTTIVKYTPVQDSEKGRYTYDFFALRGLEVGSFDEAQGLAPAHWVDETAIEARLLAYELGQ